MNPWTPESDRPLADSDVLATFWPASIAQTARQIADMLSAKPADVGRALRALALLGAVRPHGLKHRWWRADARTAGGDLEPLPRGARWILTARADFYLGHTTSPTAAHLAFLQASMRAEYAGVGPSTPRGSI